MKLASVSVTAILVVTCLSVSCEAFAGKIFMANSQENAKASAHESPIQDRRTVLRTGAAVVAGFCLTNPAQAFDNRIGELFPQLKGKPYGASTPVPKGVGDGDALKTCPSSEEALARPPPNCFSSTVPKEDTEHYFPPFKFSKNPEQAMADLVEAAKNYPPGQGKIDGGGWKIASQSEKYLYVQYESEKIGYLDDLEFLLDPKEKEVLVRSASRVGFLDFGVNAKRVNWFVDFLSKKGGWIAERISTDNHPNYFAQNGSE